MAQTQGWFGRLGSGLTKSSGRLSAGIGAIFAKRKLDDAALEQLEELLITADLGVETAARLTREIAETRFAFAAKWGTIAEVASSAARRKPSS